MDENPEKGLAPSYRFKICLVKNDIEAGHCDLRIGHTTGLYYGGNIGYTVYEEFRGNRYAAKACMLLLKLAKKHDLGYIYITCNPDNHASKRTCEIAGGSFEAVVNLPLNNDMYLDGERQKCIYRFNL